MDKLESKDKTVDDSLGEPDSQPAPQTVPPPEPFDIVEFMKDKLPPYIARCFLAAGFDSKEVIALMDTSEIQTILYLSLRHLLKNTIQIIKIFVVARCIHLFFHLDTGSVYVILCLM